VAEAEALNVNTAVANKLAAKPPAALRRPKMLVKQATAKTLGAMIDASDVAAEREGSDRSARRQDAEIVVIVPRYGLAVARPQPAVKELAARLGGRWSRHGQGGRMSDR